MKIVINRCYGGFGVSPRALAKILERKGEKVYYYVYARDANNRLTGLCRKVPEFQGFITCLITTEDLVDSADVNTVSKHAIDSEVMDWERTNPDLIAVVEELGKCASGRDAKLKVVEIPDGVDWYVSEDDGMELIEEVHRVWGNDDDDDDDLEEMNAF